ncbi:23S rRNA (uracil(1939)-C(5))-methyltransferase RlmD [Fusobacterium russii]|uniref:23S rRNA (uracil(1939)-C(5))-methyltransferase RlmD n=1 Tax=Fusobacterium russii TaxID=854 RepID=UPI00039AC4FD|nr:23S rRNA (uracil(1939)-C(5))-methyltransferase RlmD [Fusobacterium russii]
MLKKSDIVEVKIEKIVFGGEGLGYYDKSFAIFVPMSVPDDIVEVEIISVKKTYARGLIKKIIKAGPERVRTDKITFEDFDGCDFAMLEYEAQLKYKKMMVEDVMQRLGKLSNFSLDKIVASENILHYRNKIIEPFSTYNNKIISGFFKRKSHDVFEVEENILNSKLGNRIIKRLKELLNERKISVYDEQSHTGLLRNVMIRTNSKSEAMIVLIINANKISPEVENILLSLKDELKEIKSIYFSSNTKKTNTLLGEKNNLIWGSKYIQENIEGINFYISPNSFFQINLEQTKKLYSLALSMFSNIEDKHIVDAYSGTGTIAMIMAKKAKKVYSIEIVKSATEDGKRTAQENGIENIEFINGAVEEKLEELVKAKKQIDTIIFDPPRKGLEVSIINKVAELSLREVVYISCNPSTLARDIKLFTEKGYSPERLEAVDMFPQTSHVETICLLSHKAKV